MGRKVITRKIYIVILLIAAVSCGERSYVPPFDVARMQREMERNPDSIANILEEQTDPAALSEKNKADYWFLLAQTHLRQDRSLINDSLIHFSVEYYKENNSPWLSSAYRLAADQINWQGNENARQESLLLDALDVAVNRTDTVEMVKTYNSLANFYIKIKEHSKAIGAYNKILDLSSSSTERAIAKGMMGLEYAMLGMKDSCYASFEKALELAQNDGDSQLLFDMLRSYADCLNSFGDSRKAIGIINRTKGLEGRFNNEYYLNFTCLNAWLNLNRLDSAKVYLDYLERNNIDIRPSDESYFYVNDITAMLRSIYNEKRRLPAEILTIAHYGDNVMNAIWNNMNVDKERMFTQNRLAKEKDRLEMVRAQQLQIYLLIIIALLLIAGVVVFLYQRKVLQKERAIRSANERLRDSMLKLYENENIIKDLTSRIEENGEAGEREKFLLDQLIINHDVLSKLKYSPRFIKEEQWPSIINIVNVLYNNYAVRLRAEYPVLTEEDIRYCCLIVLRLTTSNIAALMSVSSTSVSKRKQRIKEKMDKVNSELFNEQSLENYLWSY